MQLYTLDGERVTNFSRQWRRCASRIPEGMISVGCTLADDQLLLVLDGPLQRAILFWDHEREQELMSPDAPDHARLEVLADSFNEFVEAVYD